MASHERYRLFFLEGSLILILLIGCVHGRNQQQPYTCGTGLSTPGYTYPLGDITLEYGKSLNISCILHENKAAEYGPNPSSLMSFKWREENQTSDIVNSTAIRLYIERHPTTKSTSYSCMINGTFVCHNVVVVGTKPQEVNDFKCIGYNYENLTCTWSAPENFVKTDYQLEYIPSVRPARSASRCPNITYQDETKSTLSCTWSFSTRPQYRHMHEHYKFILDANNTFGTRRQVFPFDHYKHVIPNPPEQLSGNGTSPHSIKLRWVIPVKMQSFDGGIEHRVRWWIDGAKDWVTLPSIINEKVTHKTIEYNLTNLPYAHYLYDIRVYMKSLRATDENMWSQYSYIAVWTKPKLPDRPPRTDAGSFEILEFGHRIVYWQNIRNFEENGEHFVYHIEVEGHPEVQPKKIYRNYAKFENLTDKNYTFKIWSKNEIGLSNEYSVVTIPSSNSALRPPSKVTKIDKGNGVYDLEWVLNENPMVTNYTVFWCADTKDRPYQCDGTMNWTVVPQGVKSSTFNLEPKNYQFAISANGYQGSSGLLWAECTVIPGRGIKLSQTYVRSVGARFIIVAWRVECVKSGDVTGFNITYCPLVSSPQSDDCKNNTLQYTIINGSYAEEGNITGLIPYTRYKIKVKPVLNGAESQFSEPVINSTNEDVPSKPRNLRVLDKTSSSMLIQWEKPSEENGNINRYEIYLDHKLVRTVYPVKEVTVYEENLTNLTSKKPYTIQVTACAKQCSKAIIVNETEAGRPDKITRLYSNYNNNLSLVILWDAPRPEVDYYEVMIESSDKEKPKIYNTSREFYLVEACDSKDTQGVYAQVRGVNKLAGEALKGDWSDRSNFRCFGSESETWVIITVVVSVIIFIALMIYLGKQLWVHIRRMRNVPVKLPDGLAAAVQTYQEKEKNIDDTLPPDEPLLAKKFPTQPMDPKGESSGYCSGTGSVSSSVESAGHLSMTDSGTEQPRSPSLGDIEGSVALRQRVTKPNVKKAVPDYVTMPEISPAPWSSKPTQGGYSVIGMATPPKKPESESEYMTLTDIPAKTSYVPFPVPQAQESTKELPVRPPPSGYVPYMAQEPAAKNTDYVLAGVPTKPSLVPSKVSSFPQKDESSSGYVTAPPMEVPKLLNPWQQQGPIEPPSAGYVVVGDTTKAQKGALEMQKGYSKGYVPHNVKFDNTKSLKED